ncbi:hypothetical protein K469DRAFT_332894 [Zopfia rhizophila CBS 207.26]|uniref:Uncharacterized protein n=1 Tax=Zopfia rhizophila CBS 207.26 TaxID=1314779 RepID=A0A6A6DJ40_9PEZI|nr:hypothetical protein K469DRAFT_332894 [Zopfia rhizophila CBS 207.26]
MTLIPHLVHAPTATAATGPELSQSLDLYANANYENASPPDKWRIMAPGGAECGPWRETRGDGFIHYRCPQGFEIRSLFYQLRLIIRSNTSHSAASILPLNWIESKQRPNLVCTGKEDRNRGGVLDYPLAGGGAALQLSVEDCCSKGVWYQLCSRIK